MKKVLSDIVTTIWFWLVIFLMLIMGVIMIFGIFFSDILVMLKSGFSTVTVGYAAVAVFGIVFLMNARTGENI